MPTPSSQGSTVSFKGGSLGRLTNFSVQPGTAALTDVTNCLSTVVGSGNETRVRREYECLAVDSGAVEITLWGCPPYTRDEVGSRGSLSVTFDGGSLSAEAILEAFDVKGSVGQFLVGTARFRMIGT